MSSHIVATLVPFDSLALLGISPKELAVLVAIVVVTALTLLSVRRKVREAQNTPRAYARSSPLLWAARLCCGLVEEMVETG